MSPGGGLSRIKKAAYWITADSPRSMETVGMLFDDGGELHFKDEESIGGNDTAYAR